MDAPSQPFSIRTGVRVLPQLGLQEVTAELRTSLWNIIEPWIFNVHYGGEYIHRARWVYNFHAIKWRTDEIPIEYSKHEAVARLAEWFFQAKWYELYDLVEALPEVVFAGVLADRRNPHELKQRSSEMYRYATRTVDRYILNLNQMLVREGAPYRYQNAHLVPITHDAELQALRDAIKRTPFNGARIHIEQAVALISKRPQADYRNAIKEAVSAVESLLQEATGAKGEKLPRLLDAFEKKYSHDFHGAFKSALGSLYGWTSDDSGIRHGIFGQETVGYAEAQFMLIACSALTNFLVTLTVGSKDD